MAFWTLYKRELNGYFQSAVGYVVLFGSALIQSAQSESHPGGKCKGFASRPSQGSPCTVGLTIHGIERSLLFQHRSGFPIPGMPCKRLLQQMRRMPAALVRLFDVVQ